MGTFLKKPGILPGLMLALMFSVNLNAQDLASATLLTRSEQFSAAERAFNVLLQKSPNDGDIYFYFGDNYLKRYFADSTIIPFKEMSDSAASLFRRGVQADPADPLNFVGLGEISLLFGDQIKAQEYFTKAKSLLPSKQNKGVQMSTEKQAVVYIKMADAYVKARVSDTAAIFDYLRTAEKLDYKNYELYIVRGDAYIQFLNDGSKAIANYNQAIALKPDSPTASLRIGQLWMKARQYQMALNYYQDVVKIDSNFAPAYRELGFLLSKANRNEEAKKYFKKFLELSAGNIGSRLQYINTLMDLQDYSEAINEVITVLSSDQSNNDLNRALAYSYFETGQYDKGLKAITDFIDKSPNEKRRSLDYAYYGRLLAKTKNDSLAPMMLLKAYELDTSKADYLSEAALSYNKVKNYPKAVEIYQQKIGLGKANSMDYYNLGKTYYNLQDYKMADSMLAIFNEQQPTYIQGFVWRARASSKLDPDSKSGAAKPVYESILEKTEADSAKYQKERIEALYYLTFYYFQIYSDTKVKEDGLKAMDYGERIVAIDPTDENAVKAKQIIDILKKNIK